MRLHRVAGLSVCRSLCAARARGCPAPTAPCHPDGGALSCPQLLVVSDLFTERSQFETMYLTLTELRKAHPSEDEVLLQYLVPATCKAAAVLGMVSQECAGAAAQWLGVVGVASALGGLPECPQQVRGIVRLSSPQCFSTGPQEVSWGR